MKTDWKDIAVKVWWTAVSAVLGVVLTVVGDLDVTWAPLLIAGVNVVHSYVRQQLGAGID